jgi:hypothetical protein
LPGCCTLRYIHYPVASWGGFFKFRAWVMKNIVIIGTEKDNMKYNAFCGDYAACLKMKVFFLPKYIT